VKNILYREDENHIYENIGSRCIDKRKRKTGSWNTKYEKTIKRQKILMNCDGESILRKHAKK